MIVAIAKKYPLSDATEEGTPPWKSVPSLGKGEPLPLLSGPSLHFIRDLYFLFDTI
jgi:hypothetical protein